MTTARNAYDVLKKRKEELDKEFAPLDEFRALQEQELKEIFARIRNELSKNIQETPFFKDILEEMDEEIIQLHAEFIVETRRASMNNTSAVAAARKLEQTLPIILNPQIPLKEKHAAAQDFYNFARNAEISAAAKISAGAAIGAALFLAGFVALCACSGCLVVAAIPLLIASGALTGMAGALSGITIAVVQSSDQNDLRGEKVYNKLRLFAQENVIPTASEAWRKESQRHLQKRGT